MQQGTEAQTPVDDDRRYAQVKGGLPDLRRFRRLQRERGAPHLDDLTPAQLGLAEVTDLHHISRMKARDGTCIFRVRICKTCSRLQHLIELGSYKRLEPAILVHDAHELLHRRTHKLRVLTAEDRPYLHLLTVSNHGRAVNLERIFVIDILADRIKKYYVARFFSGSASALMLSQVSAYDDDSSPAHSPKRSNDEGMYQTADDVVESLREMRDIVGASNRSTALTLTTMPSNLDSTLPSMAETFTYHGSLLSLIFLVFRLTGSIMDVQLDTAQFATLLLNDPARKLQIFNPASALPPSLWKLAALSYVPLHTHQLRPLIQQLDALQEQLDEGAILEDLTGHAEALVCTDGESQIAARIEVLRQRTQNVAEIVFSTSHDMRLPSWMFADSPLTSQRRAYMTHLEEVLRRIAKRMDQLLLTLQRITQKLAALDQAVKVEEIVQQQRQRGPGDDHDGVDKMPEPIATHAEIRHQLAELQQRLAALFSWDTLQIQAVALLLELGGSRNHQDSDVAVQVPRRFDELQIGDQLLGGIHFCRAGSMVSLCAQRCRTLRTSSLPHTQELKRALLSNQLLLLESCAKMIQHGLAIGIAFRSGEDIPSGSAFLSTHESAFWAYANLLAVYHALDLDDQDGLMHLYSRVTQELRIPETVSFDSLVIPPVHVVLNAVQSLLRSLREWVEHTNCVPYLICTYYSLHAIGCAASTFLAQQRFAERQEQLHDVLRCALAVLSACSDRFKVADYLWRLLRDHAFYHTHAFSPTVSTTHKRARMMTAPAHGRLPVSQPSSYTSPVVPLTHVLPEFLQTQSGLMALPPLTQGIESTNSASTTPSDDGSLPPNAPLLHPDWQQVFIPTLDAPPLLSDQLRVIHNPEIDYDYTNEEIHALLSIFDV